MLDLSPYLIVPLVALVISQILKFAFYAFSEEVDFTKLYKPGGTPHSAVAALSSLAVTSVIIDGLNSSVAGATVVLSFALISLFADVMAGKDRDSQPLLKPFFVGVVAGVVSSLILTVKYWKNDLKWLFDDPGANELKYAYIGFGALFAISILFIFWTRRRSMRKLPTSKRLNRAFRVSLMLPALSGLFFTFAQQQTLGIFDARLWTYLVILSVIGASIWFWWSTYRHAAKHLKEEATHFKKAKARTKSKPKAKRKKSSKKKK